MSSFLCFICHSTINSDTNEDTREKYREVVGMNLSPDSHLCHICCHVLNKLWMFKAICVKRSLEYPVLFSEKGTLNLQRNDLEKHTICPDIECNTNHNRYLNSAYILFGHYHDNSETESNCKVNKYVKLEHNIENDFLSQNEINDTNFDNPEVNDEITNLETNDDDTVSVVYENDGEIQENNVENYENFNNETNYDSNTSLVDNKDTNTEIREDPKEKKFKRKKSKKKNIIKVTYTLEEQKARLEAARKENKYLDAEFKCYNCAMGFLFKDTYQAHMMRHEESNGEHVCEVCTLRFATAAVLRSHRLCHSQRVECGECGTKIRGNHDCRSMNASCHLCARPFRDTNALQQHLKRFHARSNRQYTCSVCGHACRNQAAVRTHMLSHIARRFPCPLCPSVFRSPYTLHAHSRRHSDDSDNNHHCVACNTSYISRKGLLAHWKNSAAHLDGPKAYKNNKANEIEGDGNSENFVCPHCHRRYNNRKSLVRHIGTHTKPQMPKIAVCHLCGATFKGNNKLNRHLREVCEKDKLEQELQCFYENVQHI